MWAKVTYKLCHMETVQMAVCNDDDSYIPFKQKKGPCSVQVMDFDVALTQVPLNAALIKVEHYAKPLVLV